MIKMLYVTLVPVLNRLLKNKNQVVRQGARRLDKRSISGICEHWREPCNAAWRPQTLFFNSLLISFLKTSLKFSKSESLNIPCRYIRYIYPFILDLEWPSRQASRIFLSFSILSLASQNRSVGVRPSSIKIATISLFFSVRKRSRNSGTIFRKVFQSDSFGFPSIFLPI